MSTIKTFTYDAATKTATVTFTSESLEHAMQRALVVDREPLVVAVPATVAAPAPSAPPAAPAAPKAPKAAPAAAPPAPKASKAPPPPPVDEDDDEEEEEEEEEAAPPPKAKTKPKAAPPPADDEDDEEEEEEEDEKPAPKAKGKGPAVKITDTMLKSEKLREVLAELQAQGFTTTKTVIEAAVAVQGRVPVLSRMADLESRVRSSCKLLGLPD